MGFDQLQDLIRVKLREFVPHNIDDPDRIPAAVMVPFFEKNGEPHLLFTKRTSQVQYHRGEICFPGGAKDAGDADLITTALREMQEEIAVPPDCVEVIGRLDAIKTVSSYFLVVPYVGFLKQGTLFKANTLEVEELLEIPFHHFQDPSIFEVRMFTIDKKPLPVYYYHWQSHTVWGVTARILKTLLDLLRQERTVVRPK